jgi:P pilus assembly chaperone PapD
MLRGVFRTAIAVLPAALLLLGASPVSAAGLGVTPGKVAFTVRPGGTELRTLQIINQDDRASDFDVYIEGDNQDWFTVTPGRFTLDGRGQREVEIALAPPLTAGPEEYDLSLCVISVPPGAELRIGAGVKVPVHVQVTELPVMGIRWWIVSVIILVCVAAGVIVWWRRWVRYG